MPSGRVDRDQYLDNSAGGLAIARLVRRTGPRGSSRSFSSVCSSKRLQDLLYSADPREAREDSLKSKVMLFGILAGAGVFNYDEREAQARPLTQR